MTTTPEAKRRFCSACGTALLADAEFCHECGLGLDGSRWARVGGSQRPGAMVWGVPLIALAALMVLTLVRDDTRAPETVPAGATPLGQAGASQAMSAPDISSMSPGERADRLFNRVMRLSSEGKADSAAFFANMALGALEALMPLDAHRRYDMGLVLLVMGNERGAAAQADTILRANRSHLLGLSLAGRAAESRGDNRAAADFRRRLAAAEPAERRKGLQEYTDHDADIRAQLARSP